MRGVRRAIHIRSGEASIGEAVDKWLKRYGVETVCCADAFEACALILQGSAPAPELAIVGADWLAPDELPIVRYLREAWPAVGIVLYGRDIKADSHARAVHALVCSSAAAVRDVLGTSPEHLLSRVWRSVTTAGPVGDRGGRAGARGGPVAVEPRPDREQGHDGTDRLTAEHKPLSAPPAPNGPVPQLPGSHSPRGALTREELSVLLEDTHD